MQFAKNDGKGVYLDTLKRLKCRDKETQKAISKTDTQNKVD
jgi:hypothetical protein